MNIQEAKNILLLYRPGTSDREDPQTAAALALAERDPALAAWLAEHLAGQKALREKFRMISPPEGLSEQIISEQVAELKSRAPGRRSVVIAAGIASIVLVVLGVLWMRPVPFDAMSNYRASMASVALRGYAMDLETNNPAVIKNYLSNNKAPADYVLPVALQRAVLTGCAVAGWQNSKVSMICFRTGERGRQSDLWLFIADASMMKQSNPEATPHFDRINELMTATWSQGGKLYLLAREGDEAALRKYL